MTNEEFQKIVLEELGSLKHGQERLFGSVSALEQGQEKLFEGQAALEKSVSALEQGQERLFGSVSALEQGQEKLFAGQAALEKSISALEQGQKRIEKKLDAVYDQTAILTEFRTEMTEKYDHLINEVAGIRKDISTVEIVTASNYSDLARLKAVR